MVFQYTLEKVCIQNQNMYTYVANASLGFVMSNI